MPEEGFINDAQDVLHDIRRFDAQNHGKMTGSKRQSIETRARLFGRSAEVIARELGLSVEDVRQVLEAADQ